MWKYLLFLLLISCNSMLDNDVLEKNHWEYSGTAYWQLQNEEGQAVARVIVEMKAYDGVTDNVWFHGRFMSRDTTFKDSIVYISISEDSVYIGDFDTVFDTLFSIYSQDGYINRPYPGYWSMWATE